LRATITATTASIKKGASRIKNGVLKEALKTNREANER
jgi:hypothetical protein